MKCKYFHLKMIKLQDNDVSEHFKISSQALIVLRSVHYSISPARSCIINFRNKIKSDNLQLFPHLKHARQLPKIRKNILKRKFQILFHSF